MFSPIIFVLPWHLRFHNFRPPLAPAVPGAAQEARPRRCGRPRWLNPRGSALNPATRPLAPPVSPDALGEVFWLESGASPRLTQPCRAQPLGRKTTNEGGRVNMRKCVRSARRRLNRRVSKGWNFLKSDQTQQPTGPCRGGHASSFRRIRWAELTRDFLSPPVTLNCSS